MFDKDFEVEFEGFVNCWFEMLFLDNFNDTDTGALVGGLDEDRVAKMINFSDKRCGIGLPLLLGKPNELGSRNVVGLAELFLDGFIHAKGGA